MATKKPRNKKYNPDAPKHIAPGHKAVEEHELNRQELTQLVILENIVRQAMEAQTNFLIGLAADKWNYPNGIRMGFDIDWKAGKVRAIIKGKAPAAGSQLKANKKEAPDVTGQSDEQDASGAAGGEAESSTPEPSEVREGLQQ